MIDAGISVYAGLDCYSKEKNRWYKRKSDTKEGLICKRWAINERILINKRRK